MEQQSKNKITFPRYQQIAVEIASRIASGEYNVGDKIYARSSLASQYGVSSETARRAICVLSDLGIVSSEKGSGVTIKSQKDAVAFIKKHSKRQTLDTIRENLLQHISSQKKEMDSLNACLSDLITASEHFRSMNPFMPFEVKIVEKCAYLNKTISEIQFWQHTGATIIAVRRNNEVIKSPGPYMSLLDGDILYFLPQDDTVQRVNDFLYPFDK